MPTKFHIKIADLQATPAKTTTKEMLIARVLRPRDGLAGVTPKWECDLIDDDDTNSVFLAEAWGAKNIAKAKANLKEGVVYEISDYVIVDKGKSITFGNNLLKLAVSAKVGIEAKTGEHTEIPLELPLEDLANVFNLPASRVVSLNLAVVAAAEKKTVQMKTNNASKDVVNVWMKAKNLKVELAAWGRLANEMSGRTTDVRLDAVQVLPTSDGSSIKLQSLDCTSIRDLNDQEKKALNDQLSTDDNLESLTKMLYTGGKRQAEMSQKASVTNLEAISLLLTTEDKIEQTFEVPSVMMMAIAGTDEEDGGGVLISCL